MELRGTGDSLCLSFKVEQWIETAPIKLESSQSLWVRGLGDGIRSLAVQILRGLRVLPVIMRDMVGNCGLACALLLGFAATQPNLHFCSS